MSQSQTAYVTLSELFRSVMLGGPASTHDALRLVGALEVMGEAVATDARAHALLLSEHRELRSFLARLHRYMQDTDAGAGAPVVGHVAPTVASPAPASDRPPAPALHVVETPQEPAE